MNTFQCNKFQLKTLPTLLKPEYCTLLKTRRLILTLRKKTLHSNSKDGAWTYCKASKKSPSEAPWNCRKASPNGERPNGARPTLRAIKVGKRFSSVSTGKPRLLVRKSTTETLRVRVVLRHKILEILWFFLPTKTEELGTNMNIHSRIMANSFHQLIQFSMHMLASG